MMKGQVNFLKILAFTPFLLIGLYSSVAWPVKSDVNMNIQFKGHLTADKECKINNDKIIDVDFNDVIIGGIKSGRYSKDVTLEFDCPLNTDNQSVAFYLQGPESEFDPLGMGTGVKGLSIELRLNNDINMTVGDASVIDVSKPVTINILLTQQDGVDISAQPFRTQATLIAELL